MVGERSSEVGDFAAREGVMGPERSHEVAERNERSLPSNKDGGTAGDGEPFETVSVGGVVPGNEDVGANELFLERQVVVANTR